MQDISLITPPSYHHKPGNYRLLVLAEPGLQHEVTEALRESWPDTVGLSVYFVDKVDAHTAEWLTFHIPFVNTVVLYVNALTPPEFVALAPLAEVNCVVEDGNTLTGGDVSDAMKMMLYHHAEATSAANLTEVLIAVGKAAASE